MTSYEAKLIFLSFIGFFGFLQSFMIYETFRNVNSTIGIFFLGAYIINRLNFSKKIFILIRLIILLIIIILLQRFPNNSNYVHLIFKNDGSFVESSVDYFPKQKLLLIENNFYYKKLNQDICEQDKKIINLSFDFVLPYLCSSNKKKFSAMSPIFFSKPNPAGHKRLFDDNILFNDEILITSKDIKNPNVKKIFQVDLPANIFWFSMYDSYSNKIFGYINSQFY